MSPISRRALRALSFVALLAGAAGAQSRSPEEILSRYSKTVDPDGKIATIEGLRTVSTMEIPQAGMNATISGVQRRPNQIVMIITVPGLGEMKQGFDGTTAWASDPMSGPRLMTDAEAKQIQDGADFRFMGRSPDHFAKIEAAGEAQVDGEAADCVKLTWKSERVTTECFSRASGLMIEMRTKAVTPQGEVETVSRMYDYKAVGGVLMPHRIENQMMGMTQKILITEVEAGPVDAKLFELPPEIKALKKP